MLEFLLILIIVLVLILPLTIRIIEENLEAFLFVMGIASILVSEIYLPDKIITSHLLKEAFTEPIKITLAVIIAGSIFVLQRKRIDNFVNSIEVKIGPNLFIFFLILILGLISSIITAIIAAIVLAEIISILKFDRKLEIKLVIISCYSIGLGAALTPIGEPLSTIVVAKLKGPPHNADFFYLINQIGIFIIPCILGLSIFGTFLRKRELKRDVGLKEEEYEDIKSILLRASRVYLFIMALIFLGAGFKPIIDKYIIKLHPLVLYWINTVSAILDNATLTAAEISPKMTYFQIKTILMGLIISGGMLIPGNIPNIISAHKLKIKSREWAYFGVPIGVVLLILYFIIFLLIL